MNNDHCKPRPMRAAVPARLAAALLTWCLTPAILASPADARSGIRSFLEGLEAGAAPVVAGRRLNEPELLSGVYRDRRHAPIWLRGAPLEKAGPDLLAAIARSARHGFSPERYHYSTIDKLLRAGDRPPALALELLLTDAFLGQALHRSRGAVFTPQLDAEWKLPPAEVDAVGLLLETVHGGPTVSATLEALWPTDREYARLLERRAEIAASDDAVTVQVAPGAALKTGQSNDRVLMLKQRLMGPGEYSPLYDQDLLREVTAFQRAAGLEPDGIVGDNTLEVLNATRISWIDRIDANLERWRWLPRETPDTYVRVNIAAFSLRAIERGREVLAMNVIVGRPYRQTPVFAERITYMVLNPFWNVPYSIATQDKLPLLQADAVAEADKGFEAKPLGSDTFIPVDSIDWGAVTPRNYNYLLRQRPGASNALGRIKFMLPNIHSVYFHDTPGRDLFARQERSFSSGCIRLEQPLEFAAWLLSRQPRADAIDLESSLAAGETRTIYLEEPVHAYVVYFTAFVLEDGEVVFRRDIYGRDRTLIAALRGQHS